MEAIRQNGEIILYSDDGIGMKMIFRNLTSSNFQGQEYVEYIQHIAIYPLVRFNVLRLTLECLFAERPAVETHIVEVCPCIIDDVKTVGTRLVPRKAHA